MAKTGRPSKLTTDNKKTYIDALKTGATIQSACDVSGLVYDTVREWIARGEGRDPERKSTPEYAAFAADTKEAIATAEMVLLSRINKASTGERSDWRAASWILERRHSDRWSSTQKIAMQVEREVSARIEGELTAQHNQFFEKIMEDPTLSAEAKKKIFEHAASLKQEQSKAEVN